jgi:tape measure domain-containing protein
VLYQVIASVNLGLSAMEDLRQSMNTQVDTSAFDGARDSINEATMAVQEMETALNKISPMDSPVAASSGTPASIPMPVEPVAPEPLIEAPAPVQVPVEWQTDNTQMFSGKLLERFRQETASANTMLEQLSATQDTIARQAYNTMLFPPEAARNLNSLAVRIDTIKAQIRQIESNRMNIGVDAANAQLEQMNGLLSKAQQEQQALNRAVVDMDVQAANEAYLQLSGTIRNTERYIQENTDGQGRFNQAIRDGTQQADTLMETIKRAVAAYATIQTVGNILSLSDQMTSIVARLDMMNDGLQSTKQLQDMIYLSAEHSRASYQDTADAVAKIGLMAGNAFENNAETIAFVEQINKHFAIAGTSASGIQAAMLQMTQAMGSGVLRGEEFNSILEQAPNIIQTISGYIEENGVVLEAVASAMGMKTEELAGNVQGKMKDIAGEGLLSAELFKAAILWAMDETNAKFESMPETFEQIWTGFQRAAMKAFEPVLERISDIGNSEEFQAFVSNAIEGVAILSGVVLNMFDLMGDAAGFVQENWGMIAPSIGVVTAALVGYCTVLGIYNGIQLISNGLKAAAAFMGQVHAASLAMETGATFTATAGQYGFNAALLACPITWIVLAIIGLIAVIIILANHFSGAGHIAQSAFGAICGAGAVAAAFLLNLVIGLINALIQATWNTFVEPFIGIIEWVLNAANGGFNDFGGMVANLIGNIISWFLSLGKVVTKIIDAIFGTNWTAGLSALQDTVLEWGKNENAITLDRNAPVLDYRMDYSDAYQSGASWGDGISDKVGGAISDLFGAENNIPNPDDYASTYTYGGDPAGIASGIDDIAGNTGKIADSMEITAEELKYLRDLAEQETVNRYTTAEIHIDMSGMQNTIQNGEDLDGFLSGLTDATREAIDIGTEGVHE